MPHGRLSGIDAGFLYLEDERTHMHMSSLAIFEEGPADYDAVVEHLERRLHRFPRFRHKVAFVPMRQGRPVWVDDPDFDIHYHVKHLALPAPGTEDQLKDVCGDLLSRQLDRARPLWEIYLIDGLSGGRTAMLSKVHHAMVDGVAGAGILEVHLDLSPDPEPVEPEPWEPEPEPDGVELLAQAMKDRITTPIRTAQSVLGALSEPGETLERAARYARGVGALARSALDPAPGSPLNARIGRQRRYAFARSTLDEFKEIRSAFDATVNDVVLAVVAGGLRAWCLARKDEPCAIEAMIPVDIREDADEEFGNRVGMMIADIPADEPNPLRRLEKVKARMGDAKSSRQALGAELMAEVTNHAPSMLLPFMGWFRTTRPLFNVVVTNVPGPQMPLFSLGTRMTELFPQAPLASDQALSIAILSYDGKLGFGLLADYDAMPDVDLIATGIEASAQELLDLARQPIEVEPPPAG